MAGWGGGCRWDDIFLVFFVIFFFVYGEVGGSIRSGERKIFSFFLFLFFASYILMRS